jgi:hypothetical protein
MSRHHVQEKFRAVQSAAEEILSEAQSGSISDLDAQHYEPFSPNTKSSTNQ